VLITFKNLESRPCNKANAKTKAWTPKAKTKAMAKASKSWPRDASRPKPILEDLITGLLAHEQTEDNCIVRKVIHFSLSCYKLRRGSHIIVDMSAAKFTLVCIYFTVTIPLEADPGFSDGADNGERVESEPM
jgi:hypothetical protein